jgi:hypothetical protein
VRRNAAICRLAEEAAERERESARFRFLATTLGCRVTLP